MSLVSKVCKQTAIRWPLLSKDSYGQPVFGAPEAVLVRWEDTAEEQIAADGVKFVTRSKALALVDMRAGDYLQLAALEDTTNTDPRMVSDAYVVRSFAKIPNKRGKPLVRWAYM